MLVSAIVIQGLTGTGRSFSKMAHWYSWQTGIGCWLDASVPCRRDLSIKPLEYPQDTQSEWPKEQSRSRHVFYCLDTSRSHTASHWFCWSPRPTLKQCGRGKGQGRKYQEARVSSSHHASWQPQSSQFPFSVLCRHRYNNIMDKKLYIKI